MGFNVNRVIGKIEDELICSICSAVLEDPVQIAECEHMFCRQCITEWLRRNYTCPVDRRPLGATDVIAVPRIVRNMLARLTVRCEFEPYGCNKVLKLETYKDHVSNCEHDPRRPIICDRGCGLAVPSIMKNEHECVNDLRGIILKQQTIICEQSLSIQTLRRERNMYQELVRFFHLEQPNQVRELSDRIEEAELQQWKASMRVAVDIEWNDIIGAPRFEEIQELKAALYDSCCPVYYQSNLAECCDQNKWPLGISSDYRRTINRRILDNYICYQMLEHEALVVFNEDNKHMVDDFVLPQPGIIILLKREQPAAET